MARKLRVSVDKTQCVSNQMCVTALPSVFRLDDDGIAEAFDPSAASEEELIEAGANCPVGAISVTDADTGEDLLAD
jgi:ferredoxin